MIRTHVSELAIDRLIAGEIDPFDAAVMREHAAECARCEAALTDALEVKRAFSAPLSAIPLPRRRLAAPAIAAITAVAAVVAVVIAWPRGEPAEEVRTKGSSIVGFFVAHHDQVRRGAVHETVMPGDRVSFTTSTTVPVWFAAIGDDAAGVRSVYVPPRLIEPGRDREVPLATELDDTLGDETVTGVFCQTPFDARSVDPATPPPGCTVDRFTLVKVPR